MFRSVIRSPAIAACGALGAVAAGSARATNWLVTMGGGVNLAPPYEGAGNDDPRPSLTFNLRRANVSYRFTPPDGGNTIALISTHRPLKLPRPGGTGPPSGGELRALPAGQSRPGL